MDNNQKTQNESSFDARTAKELIQKERQQRVAECSKELYSVLEKHNCSLDVSVLITSEKTIPQLSIIPKPD